MTMRVKTGDRVIVSGYCDDSFDVDVVTKVTPSGQFDLQKTAGRFRPSKCSDEAIRIGLESKVKVNLYSQGLYDMLTVKWQ